MRLLFRGMFALLLAGAFGGPAPSTEFAAGTGPSTKVSSGPDAISRPPITGIAHIGLRTDNLEAARKFYGGVLGFQEPFTVDKPSGGLMLTYFKVNDHQYVEVFPELKSPTEDRLSHIAFETTDIQALRTYLASKGVAVPQNPKPGLDGNPRYSRKDPDGHS